jgi:predicted nucleic acid-binding protein
MVRSLNDFGEKKPIFIDANIFLYHAFNTNNDAVNFLKKVEASSFKASTSSLVLEEVFFKLLMQSASNFIERVTVEKVKSALRDDTRRASILRPLVEYKKYIGILGDAGMKVFDLTGQDVLEAIEASGRHNLLVADAAHLAVMKRKQIDHLASGDSDFSTVPDITLWSPFPASQPELRS